MTTISAKDYGDKRISFLNKKSIHPTDKIKFLNIELKLLKEYVEKGLSSGDMILCNRLQMLEEYYKIETESFGGITGHFWVVPNPNYPEESIIDECFDEVNELLAKAWLGTTKYKKVYRPVDTEIQDEMIAKWITPRIKKYRNVLLKYKKYFKKSHNGTARPQNWIQTLDRLTEPEEGRCHMNAMINYLKDEDSKIVYGDYGICSPSGGEETYYEYEHNYNKNEVLRPPHLDKLTGSEIQKIMKIYN